MKHTPEPWRADIHKGGEYIGQIEGRDSNHPHDPQYIRTIAVVLKYAGQAEGEANLERIVACVNACKGRPTKALEEGVIKELLEALKTYIHIPVLPDIGSENNLIKAINKAQAAIAKAEGEAD